MGGSFFYLSICLYVTWDSFIFVFTMLFHAGLLDFSLIHGKKSTAEWIIRLGFSRYLFYSFLSTSSRLTIGGKILAMTGNHAKGVDFKNPKIIHLVRFSSMSISFLFTV